MSTVQQADTGNLTAVGAALVQAATKSQSATPTSVKTDTKTVKAETKTSTPSKTTTATKPATVTKKVATTATKDPADFIGNGAAKKVTTPSVYWPDTYTLAVNEKSADVADTPNKKVIEIRLYDESCFGCHHVMLGEEKDAEAQTEACHHSRGNLYCPASHVRFRSVGKKMRLLQKMKRAQAKGDINRLAQLVASSGEELSAEDRREVLIEIGLLNPALEEENKAAAVASKQEDSDADQE